MIKDNVVVYKNKDFICKELTYSIHESLVAFRDFIDILGYTTKTKRGMMEGGRLVHRLYPDIYKLNSDINKKGLINLAKQVGKLTPQRVTAYIYFLAMAKLVTINFDDYFRVNPATIIKLDRWYSLYEKEYGIVKVLEQSKLVVMKYKNRKYNWDREKKYIRKTCIYLILRYKLFSILELSIAQWNEYITLLKSKTGRYSKQYTPIVLLQQVFWELGVFEIRLDDYISSVKGCTFTKEYLFDQMPNVKPITDIYKAYIIKKYSKETIGHKFHDLEMFFRYLKDKFGYDYKLSSLTRGVVYDYISYIRAQEYSASFKQGRSYTVKLFLEFVLANYIEFKNKGISVPENFILVKEDFKIKPVTYLPRPISNDIIEAFLDELKNIPDRRFNIFFLLLLTTGIPQREVLHLTKDCIKKIGDNSYEIFYFREKVKKYKITKVDSVVYELITNLKRMNTQIKPLPHPSGKNVFYLFNDGGNILKCSWYKRWFDILKQRVIAKKNELSKKVSEIKIHQLRHTFATNMRERGADILTLSNLMGHESINTTRIYAKENDYKKIEIVNKLENAFSCEAFSDLQAVLNGVSADKLLGNMTTYHNRMGIGICIIDGYKNCPMAHRCLDCIYLCSTKEDLPEMLRMLKSLQEVYNDAEEEKILIKRKIERLCDKIAALRIPNVPEKKTSKNNDLLKFV